MSRTYQWTRQPASKRKADTVDYNPKGLKRANNLVLTPARTYSNSMVPAASRGYTPNSQELKVVDTGTAIYNCDTTGDIRCVNLCTLGSDMTNRIGRKICLSSFQMRGYLRNAASVTGAAAVVPPSQCRWMLVWDTQPNGALPSITDILNSGSSTSQLNLNNRDRFRIIREKIWALDPYIVSATASQSVATAVNQTKTVKVFKKLKDLEVIFNSTNGGTIADIQTGALLSVWVGNSAASADGPEFVGSYRVRFSDK